MTEDGTPQQGELEILRVGDRLRIARESAGLSIADIATRTRITQRHLEAIERSDFDALPGRTYVTGFARAYARAVDLSDADVARDVRAELDGGAMRPRELYEAYEPADPDRVPSRRVALTVLGVVAVLAVAYGTWRTLALDSGDNPVATSAITAAGDAQDQAGTAQDSDGAAANPASTSADAAATEDARVVLSVPVGSGGNAWVGFDNAEGKSEEFRTLDPGEELVVPVGHAQKYTLRTANAQFLRITVNGREIGPIGPAGTLIKNISLKPADLLARAQANANSQNANAQNANGREAAVRDTDAQNRSR